MSEECSHVVFEHDTLHKYHLDWHALFGVSDRLLYWLREKD